MSDTILVAADSVAVVFVDDGIVYLLHSFFRNLMTLYPLVVVIGVVFIIIVVQLYIIIVLVINRLIPEYTPYLIVLSLCYCVLLFLILR